MNLFKIVLLASFFLPLVTKAQMQPGPPNSFTEFPSVPVPMPPSEITPAKGKQDPNLSRSGVAPSKESAIAHMNSQGRKDNALDAKYSKCIDAIKALRETNGSTNGVILQRDYIVLGYPGEKPTVYTNSGATSLKDGSCSNAHASISDALQQIFEHEKPCPACEVGSATVPATRARVAALNTCKEVDGALKAYATEEFKNTRSVPITPPEHTDDTTNNPGYH